jgi:hypothetical protein
VNALGIVNGLDDLGVSFTVVGGKLVPGAGPSPSLAVAKQVKAYEQELVALLASPRPGATSAVAVHGAADLRRLDEALSEGPVVAVCQVGSYVAFAADGERIVVISVERLSALEGPVRDLLDGGWVISAPSRLPEKIEALDITLPTRLLELAGELRDGVSLDALVAEGIGDSAQRRQGACELAELSYTTRAISIAGNHVLDRIDAVGMLAVLQLELDVARVLAGATRRGVRVVGWHELVADQQADLDDAAAAVRGELGVAFDAEGLDDELRRLGIPDEAITNNDLAGWSDEPVVAAILRAREARAFLQGCGQPYSKLLSAAGDGRLHPQFNSLGESARISASAPAILNTPRRPWIRRRVVPTEGCTFIEADFSGSQLRIIAHELEVKKLLELFADGVDVHRWMAAQHLGCAIDTVTDEEKAFGKVANFGLLYGVGGDGFRRFAREQYDLPLSEQDAAALMDLFFSTFPEIEAWHASEKAQPTTVAVTPLGRRLDLQRPGITFNARLARKIQAIEADALKTALVELESPLARLDAHIVMPIHDAILIEAPHAQVSGAKQALVDTMRRAMERFIPTVPVVVKAKTGTDWSLGA